MEKQPSPTLTSTSSPTHTKQRLPNPEDLRLLSSLLSPPPRKDSEPFNTPLWLQLANN